MQLDPSEVRLGCDNHHPDFETSHRFEKMKSPSISRGGAGGADYKHPLPSGLLAFLHRHGRVWQRLFPLTADDPIMKPRSYLCTRATLDLGYWLWHYLSGSIAGGTSARGRGW